MSRSVLRWVVAVAGVMTGAAVLAAGVAQATPLEYHAVLSGAAENPPVASPGTGLAVVIYDPDTILLTVSVSFSGLIGTTTVAHIHCCVDPFGNVGVATYPGTFPGFPAGVTSGSYTGTWSLDDFSASSFTAGFLASSGGSAAAARAALLAGLESGKAYVNVHTSFAPGGEIRGFLAAVPEPGSLLLFAAGALIVAKPMRRTGHLSPPA